MIRLIRYFACSSANNIVNSVSDSGSSQNSNTSEFNLDVKLEDVEITYLNCVPFVPPITSGVVVKVYDGDTITIGAKLPYNESLLYRFSVRLNGIDAPEIKGKTADEKKAALVSKKVLESLLLRKTVTLRNTGTEKWGRILADVYLDDLHINKWLLDNKYAVPYNGGTKKSPESWLAYNDAFNE